METEKLKQQIAKLELRLKKLEDSIGLEENFTGRQVFKREVQFMAKVYDKNGGIVTEINA